MLEAKGISTRIVHMPTIKPLDKDLVRDCADRFKIIITAENHSVIGGLGSAVLEELDYRTDTKIIRLGLQDKFGQTGTIEWLLDTYQVNAKHIYKKVLENIPQ
jgi:transketolase